VVLVDKECVPSLLAKPIVDGNGWMGSKDEEIERGKVSTSGKRMDGWRKRQKEALDRCQQQV
jgi:hypothetical protein